MMMCDDDVMMVSEQTNGDRLCVERCVLVSNFSAVFR